MLLIGAIEDVRIQYMPGFTSLRLPNEECESIAGVNVQFMHVNANLECGDFAHAFFLRYLE